MELPEDIELPVDVDPPAAVPGPATAPAAESDGPAGTADDRPVTAVLATVASLVVPDPLGVDAQLATVSAQVSVEARRNARPRVIAVGARDATDMMGTPC
ncbi:MAG: hypothetical protein M3R07_00105 [Gemmatimonadota bacterium]|nr:hypothetical protein [Gemmatimonadota bacterium]